MFKVAVPSYLEEEYAQILAISEDADKLDAQWNDWRIKSAKRIKQMEQMGMQIERIIIHPTALQKYCEENDLAIIGSSRAEMAQELMKGGR